MQQSAPRAKVSPRSYTECSACIFRGPTRKKRSSRPIYVRSDISGDSLGLRFKRALSSTSFPRTIVIHTHTHTHTPTDTIYMTWRAGGRARNVRSLLPVRRTRTRLRCCYDDPFARVRPRSARTRCQFNYTTNVARVRRPGPGEPVRRRVHQRPAVAQPHTAEDRRDGRGRRAAVRHIQTVARVARMRVENTEPLPGDGQHQARRDRRQQAEGGHAGRGAPHRGVQDGEPRHFQLGDSRQVIRRPRPNEKTKKPRARVCIHLAFGSAAVLVVRPSLVCAPDRFPRDYLAARQMTAAGLIRGMATVTALVRHCNYIYLDQYACTAVRTV